MALLMLIHPTTGDTFFARRGEGGLARAFILDGYEPVGPNGQEAARQIREEDAEARARRT